MSKRTNRRSKPKNTFLQQSIRVYLQMQKAETDDVFQRLLAEHDRLTDADGKPRLVLRALEACRPRTGVAHLTMKTAEPVRKIA
jgi:hypothetical protein